MSPLQIIAAWLLLQLPLGVLVGKYLHNHARPR
jgi:hypothetical protein